MALHQSCTNKSIVYYRIYYASGMQYTVYMLYVECIKGCLIWYVAFQHLKMCQLIHEKPKIKCDYL